ncbi:MAG TPA: HNH endonuclease, partial [Micromonospora sp.]
ATDAAGAFTWLTRLARGLGVDDPRSMDTRRADILAALLNGRLVVNPDDTADTDTDAGTDTDGSGDHTESAHDTGAAAAAGSEQGRPIQPVTPGKPLIQIVIAHSTLIGADDQPAELAGFGPIPASLARETAADGVWRRLVTDPLSGTLLDYGRTTYHPPAGLADHVRARDLYCRAPACRRKAADAELDHITAWSDGGTTSEHNLAAYCTHGHRIKTYAPGWKVHAHPDGSLTWTTPTGHQHTTRPHDYGPEPPGPPPRPHRHGHP